jgi:hypothetical protein
LYRPGDGIDLVVLGRTTENAAIWDRLAQARLQMTFEACYCSVLGECWISDLNPTNDPKHVDQCVEADAYRE